MSIPSQWHVFQLLSLSLISLTTVIQWTGGKNRDKTLIFRDPFHRPKRCCPKHLAFFLTAFLTCVGDKFFDTIYRINNVWSTLMHRGYWTTIYPAVESPANSPVFLASVAEDWELSYRISFPDRSSGERLLQTAGWWALFAGWCFPVRTQVSDFSLTRHFWWTKNSSNKTWNNTKSKWVFIFVT